MAPSPDRTNPPATGDGSDPFAVDAASPSITIESPAGQRSIRIARGESLLIGSSVGELRDLCTDNISGHHATLYFLDGQVTVEDIGSDGRGSTNGVYVNGQRLLPRQPRPVTSADLVALARDPALWIRIDPR